MMCRWLSLGTSDEALHVRAVTESGAVQGTTDEMYWTYMRKERRRNAPLSATALRVAPEMSPCGVARCLLGITKPRSPRLAWRHFRGNAGAQDFIRGSLEIVGIGAARERAAIRAAADTRVSVPPE